MASSTTRTLTTGLPALVLGLAIGLLGSLSDDIFGAGGAVWIAQVALWVAAGILIAASLLSVLAPSRDSARRPRHGRPAASR